MITNIRLNVTLDRIGELLIYFSFLFITSEKEGSCLPNMATFKSEVVY